MKTRTITPKVTTKKVAKKSINKLIKEDVANIIHTVSLASLQFFDSKYYKNKIRDETSYDTSPISCGIKCIQGIADFLESIEYINYNQGISFIDRKTYYSLKNFKNLGDFSKFSLAIMLLYHTKDTPHAAFYEISVVESQIPEAEMSMLKKYADGYSSLVKNPNSGNYICIIIFKKDDIERMATDLLFKFIEK